MICCKIHVHTEKRHHAWQQGCEFRSRRSESDAFSHGGVAGYRGRSSRVGMECIRFLSAIHDNSTAIFQAQELRGRIIHLDEVLTMSARMAVTTGDPKWERPYRQFEGELDAAIQSAIALVPDTGSTEQTDAANVALIGMEDRAFELVRLGELAAARAILFGEEYARQKAIYAEGMTILGEGSSQRRRIRPFKYNASGCSYRLFSISVVIVLLVIGWIVVIRLLHQWRK